jgi:hypothetical protein
MKPIYKELLIVFICLILGYAISKYILTSIRGSEYNERKYDCSMAAFHPDYPVEVKQKCRELKNENRTSK